MPPRYYYLAQFSKGHGCAIVLVDGDVPTPDRTALAFARAMAKRRRLVGLFEITFHCAGGGAARKVYPQRDDYFQQF